MSWSWEVRTGVPDRNSALSGVNTRSHTRVKTGKIALAGVAQLVGALSCNRKVLWVHLQSGDVPRLPVQYASQVCAIPGPEAYGPVSGLCMYWRQPINASLTSMFPSLFSSLSKKKKKGLAKEMGWEEDAFGKEGGRKFKGEREAGPGVHCSRFPKAGGKRDLPAKAQPSAHWIKPGKQF